MKRLTPWIAAYFVFVFPVFSCNTIKNISSHSDLNYRIKSYDDTSLAIENREILLPYNRFIDPAGLIIKFGNPSLENHSLDCAFIPGTKTLVVEERYGLVFVDGESKQIVFQLPYTNSNMYSGLMSTYCGIKIAKTEGSVHIYWGAANTNTKKCYVMEAVWNGHQASFDKGLLMPPLAPAPMSLPNDLALNREGNEDFLYVVLNGNNQLLKIALKDKKIIWTAQVGMAPFGVALLSGKAYVTNWAGAVPGSNEIKETSGIPYAKAFSDPRTGATSRGTVSVINLQTGVRLNEIEVGLHPNAIIADDLRQLVYVCNGNSDNVSILNTVAGKIDLTFPVHLDYGDPHLVGDSPNALALDQKEDILYVANGMDNAIAVIELNQNKISAGRPAPYIKGYIPTGAYPSAIVLSDKVLYVANLEGEGSRADLNESKTYTPHQQLATLSIIAVPDESTLKTYTQRVEKSNLIFRSKLSILAPRKGTAPRPLPQRVGEPSIFKHVIYIIKENKTYDQVLGDMKQGNGWKSLCIYGQEITPNQHKLAKEFGLLDNYYVSGKSSAEGHSWAEAAIVTEDIEKNVRARFLSYPHVLADALAYNREGFLWNNALDHGKSVRIYGEACTPVWKEKLEWKDIYEIYQKDSPFVFVNTTTLSRLTPILSPTYPCYEGETINDQIRADAFIKELKNYEQQPGDKMPDLSILALPSDHTAGMREGFPTPRAMVADNDLALGKIIEAITNSRFWNSTVVFVTEDDSQSGWDHISAYRTTGFVISPYSKKAQTVHTNYNQTSMVRTIEQILAIPPTNIMDATALPMFDCFDNRESTAVYTKEKNNIPLDEMNKKASTLKGKAKKFALLSATAQFEKVDGGDDDLLNRILWFSAKGSKPYPRTKSYKYDKD
ncbi:MAG: hypothetical protein NVS1B13_13630 [Flavisolibacter sp.]